MPRQADSSSSKAPVIQAVADRLLSESLFPSKPGPDDLEDNVSDQSDDSQKKDPLATKVWRMYTKAKDNLPNGARMENLTWRMMAMTLKQKNVEAEKAAAAAAAAEEASIESPEYTAEAMAMDEDDDHCITPREYRQYQDDFMPSTAIAIEQRASPPPADDTTALLSSSAPPYMMDFLRENLELPPEPRNVMVSGSTRANSSNDDIHHCTVCFHGYYFYDIKVTLELCSLQSGELNIHHDCIPPMSVTWTARAMVTTFLPWTLWSRHPWLPRMDHAS